MARNSTHVWKPVHVVLHADRRYERPYEDVDVAVAFRGPEGAELHLGAFWDGGKRWVARLAAPSPGRWTWVSTSSQPGDGGLHGRRGYIDAAAYEGPHPVYHHGFLKASDDGRYLCRRDGEPFLWLGDARPAALLDATDDELDRYVEFLIAHGMNVAQTALHLRLVPHRAGSGRALEEVGRHGAPPNLAYLRSVDARLARATERGLAVALVLLAPGPTPSTHPRPDRLDRADRPGRRARRGPPMAEERAARLARYAVARYGAYDVVWLVPLDGDYVQSLGEAVRAADPYGHPLGSYARAGTAPGEDPGSEGWPDLRVFRADPAEDLHYRLALQEALRWPRRPVIAEGAGDGPDAAGLADEGAVRRAAWWSLLSGAVGYTHSVPGTSAGWRRHAEPGDPHPTREEEVDVPGPRPLRRVRDLLESADWPSLEPDPDLVVNQPSDPLRHVAAARAPHLLVLYAPDSESVVVDRRRSGVFGHAILETRAEWYNPETGERFDTPYFPGGGCITFLVPRDRHRDWVLVARDRVLS